MNIIDLTEQTPGGLRERFHANPLFCRTSDGAARILHCDEGYICGEVNPMHTINRRLGQILSKECGSARTFMLYGRHDSTEDLEVIAVFVDGKYVEPGKLTDANAKQFFRRDEKEVLIERQNLLRRFAGNYNEAA